VPPRRLGHGQAVEQYARLHAPSFVVLPIQTRRVAKAHRSAHPRTVGGALAGVLGVARHLVVTPW
jgi:hypothetical protein